MANINFKNICKLVEASTKEETQDKIANSFVADLTYSICEYNRQHMPNKVSLSYKPSSLNCIRNMYFQVIGADIDIEQDTTTESIGIGESGTARHIDIQNAVSHMKDVGIDCEYINVADYVTEHKIPNLEVIEQCGNETKLFNSKYNMRFLCDGIIKYNGVYYILEIKTETSFKFNKRTYVDDSHNNQAIAYSLNLGLNNVIFLYENRDTCAKKCYMFTVTDIMRNQLIEKIETCDKYIMNKKAPPKPKEFILMPNNKNCRYCNYRLTCKSIGDE